MLCELDNVLRHEDYVYYVGIIFQLMAPVWKIVTIRIVRFNNIYQLLMI